MSVGSSLQANTWGGLPSSLATWELLNGKVRHPHIGKVHPGKVYPPGRHFHSHTSNKWLSSGYLEILSLQPQLCNQFMSWQGPLSLPQTCTHALSSPQPSGLNKWSFSKQVHHSPLFSTVMPFPLPLAIAMLKNMVYIY